MSPSSTGTSTTKGISRSMASVGRTRKTVLSGNQLPFGIPYGREGTTLGCCRCDSRRPHIECRVYSAGRGDAPDNRLGRGQTDCGSISQGVETGVNMSKTKMKPTVIPKFSRESEEAAWWDAHRSEIEAEIRQRVKQKRPVTLGNLL